MTYGVRIGVALVGLAAAGLLAACGGSHPTASATPTPGLASYADCLRQHGVTVEVPTGRPSGVQPSGVRPSGVRPSGVRPSGGRGAFPGFGNTPPSGVDQATWDAAQQACAGLRPSFGPGGAGGGRNNGANAAYLNCLREHGVTASGGPNQLSTTDPKVAAAMTACAPLRPTGRPSPTG